MRTPTFTAANIQGSAMKQFLGSDIIAYHDDAETYDKRMFVAFASGLNIWHTDVPKDKRKYHR